MNKLLNVMFLLFVCMLLILPCSIFAKEAGEVMEEVVVTATRISTPEEEVGSSINVITAKEIEAKGYFTVHEALKGIPGLDVSTEGGQGQGGSVFMRGANSYHTLVLIDGVEMNDPTGINRGFKFANLTVDNIERIEVLRGPQSVLYGADAMGGVINIITRKGKGKPAFYLGGEGGSYNTWREFGGGSMGNERFDLSLGVSHISSDGFSATDEDLEGNSEDDRWENTSASARMGLVLSENTDLDFVFRFHDGRTHLDNGGGANQDQEDYLVDERKIFLKGQARVFVLDGLWEQTFSYGFGDHDRDYRNDPWVGEYSYDGEKQEISWQHNLYLHETNTLTMGLEYEQEGMDDHTSIDRSVHTYSVFVQDQIKLMDRSFTTLGLRYDDHEEFGKEVTYRITQAFLIRDRGTKFKGSYGTGFRAPSLNELYYVNPWGGPGGNPDLNPEKSKGWDIGIEQSFSDDVTVGITYFQNDFDDLIEWDNGYDNVNKAQTRGVESFVEASPLKDLSLRLNYTYTDTEDDTGKRLLRRPLHKVGFNTFYRFLNRGTVNLDILYVGERDDSYWDTMAFTARDVAIDDYVVVNLAGSFDISERFHVFARIENLFDEDYYEAYGYGTAGFSAYGGVKIEF